MTKKTYAIIHGHFYQPPRENPWTQSIERQESAAPYHDWNERVSAECYTPNARSRVLDDQGRVVEVVNNYAHISFNFGPTLLTWLEEHAPKTYARILEADRESEKRLGHGNAMAQVYNHVIMPLAEQRDRITQIRWGLADFEHRFGRKAEGMWLAETACNQAVAEDLVKEGVRFIILAPSQAELIRGPKEPAWRDVSAGEIKCGRAYKIKCEKGDLAVMFYHDGASQSVAFEHVLRNASFFADRIESAAKDSTVEDCPDRLAILATDGESYGHHDAMGDMCLAYLTTRELPGRDIQLTNPGAWIAQHPPTWEVKLKPGEGGLGTAWSCAHGVGRWRKDCGCQTGGPPSWNQAWRKPLRQTFDALRERIDPLFEQLGTSLLKNPWAARDDYIQVLLGKPVGATSTFFERHQKRELSDDERAQVFRLMEMQLHGLLMYTSCAWFFSELSGIETVQSLAYFARTAQLGEVLAGHPVSPDALENLKEAQSNISSLGTGVQVLERLVRPQMLTPAKVAAHQAVRALLSGRSTRDRLYGYRIKSHSQGRDRRFGIDAFCGRLTVLADRTAEGGTFEVAVLAGKGLAISAFVRPYDQSNAVVRLDDIFSQVDQEGYEGALAFLASRYDEELGLTDMLTELRLKAMAIRVKPALDEIGQAFDSLYQKHKGLLRSLAPLGVGLPEELRPVVGYAASRRLSHLMDQNKTARQGGMDLSAATKLFDLAASLNLPLDLRRANRRASRYLLQELERVMAKPQVGPMEILIEHLKEFRAMRLTPNEAPLQDKLAEQFDELFQGLLDPKRPGGPKTAEARALMELAGYLNLNVDKARAQLAGSKP